MIQDGHNNSTLPQQPFDIEEYVNSQRVKDSEDGEKKLSEIRNDLTDKLAKQRQELHELINQQYEDFLGLSTSLVGIDATIKKAKEQTLPSTITNEIQTIQTTFSEKLDFVQSRLSYRSRIREKKQTLRLFIDLSQLLDRVEEVMRDASRFKDANNLNEFVKSIERASVDFNQIRYFVTRGTPGVGPITSTNGDNSDDNRHPFIKVAGVRMRDIEKSLKTALYSFLVNCIDTYTNEDDKDANNHISNGGDRNSDLMIWLSQCLRAYSTIDDHKEAENIIRSRMVRPFIGSLIVDSYPDKGMGMDSEKFTNILNKILSFVSNKVLPLRSSINSQFPSNPYSIETRVVWREISDAFVSRLPLLFVPAMPDRFHANYHLACKFASDFHSLFEPATSGITDIPSINMPIVAAAAATPLPELAFESSFIAFYRKWQLDAYFSIRKAQIVNFLESDSLSSPFSSLSPQPSKSTVSSTIANNASAQHNQPNIPDTTSSQNDTEISTNNDNTNVDAIMNDLSLCTRNAGLAIWAIRRCWASDVYVEPLAYRYWQLMIQVIMWYRDQVVEDIDKQSDDIAIRGIDKAKQSNGTGTSSTEIEARSAILNNIYDILVIRSRVMQIIDNMVDTLRKMLPQQSLSYQNNSNSNSNTMNNAVVDDMRSCIEKLFDSLKQICENSLDSIGNAIVAKSCSDIPSHLRRTIAQFRHTGRAPPSNPSTYITKLFSELESIRCVITGFASSRGNNSDASVAHEFSHITLDRLQGMVCSGISREFARAALDSLIGISKTEASLLRLRKIKEYTSSALSSLGNGPADAPVPPGVDLRGKTPETDNDKIRRQIWLDANELKTRVISGYGFAPDRRFNELDKMIEPFGV